MDEVDLGMCILRVAAGLTVAAHGWAKFTKGGRLPGLAGWFDSMGMRPGPVHARVAATTETAGGVFLAAGFLTPLVALAIVAVMTVAAYTVHRGHFFILDDGWEYTFIIATIATVVATVGPGDWSVDGLIGFELDGWAGLAIAAGGGLAAAALHLALFYRPSEDKAPA
ncbi:MAG: DoxX family membrane protein [Acidimicrobiia bacterium]|nr:DoxX family membrane protein [Acidimicrobiia bacterium]